MKNAIKRMVGQIKNGCKKDICFSRYCLKNKLRGKDCNLVNFKFLDPKELDFPSD